MAAVFIHAEGAAVKEFLIVQKEGSRDIKERGNFITLT